MVVKSFVHLHVHSRFSFADGACDLDDLITQAIAFKMPAVALTDHQGLYGAIRFYRKAVAAGIKPILGTEIVLESAGPHGVYRDSAQCDSAGGFTHAGFGRATGSGWHLTLLVRNLVGYRNLCRLLSKTHVRSKNVPSVVTLSDLRRFSEGLIGLSGCLCGEIPAAVAAGDTRRAKEVTRVLAGCFDSGDFYIELLHDLTPKAPQRILALVRLADSLGLPVVASNNVHYVRSEEFRLHDVLSSVGTGVPLPGPYDRPNAELWFKPASLMRELFSGVPRACDSTLEIAERCELDLEPSVFHFPAADIPQGETPYSLLSKFAWRGLEERYRPMIPEALRRLQHELAVIDRLGFSEYFLVVKEIVDFARDRGIRYSGRGSAAGSIVTYALGITAADPIKHDLLFERFLNPQRRQMPDIDVDFDSARRDEVIEFIYHRFGSEHVAMVATISTMTARSAVRTVARALGYSPAEVDSFSRHLPRISVRNLKEVLETYPECEGHPLLHPRHEMLLELAGQLCECPMHLGTHLGGFVITRDPINSWVPLQWAAKGVVVSQYDKDDIEALGLVKIDILGLRMHSAISETLQLASARLGYDAVPEPFDLEPTDPMVYEMIARGDTVGVFQLESSGQRNLSQRLAANRFEDIIAQISLFRPGPLEAEMITPFIRRRHGIEPVDVAHPEIEHLLSDSYGVIVYQEQVLLVARMVAGFNLAEADLLRRAMTKGRSRAEMNRIRDLFIDRAVARGVDSLVAEEVFSQLEGFAAYGFNKAHAVCFAKIAYASAWLKKHYPAEFTVAIMNNEPMGFYTPRHVLNDARNHGIEILPPHVNESRAAYSVEREGTAIRVGLKDVREMSARLCTAIEKERAVRPFRDLADFMRRTRADTPAIEALIRIGAFDGLGISDAGRPPTRDELLALLPDLKAVITREGVAGDDVLYLLPTPACPVEDSTHPSGWSLTRRVSAEVEFLGLTLSCHPLDLAARDLMARGITYACNLRDLPDGARIRVCGVRERVQTPPTRSGKRTCFLTLEDASGLLDIVVFESTLLRFGSVIAKHSCYLVEGRLQNNHERGLAIIAETIQPYVIEASLG